MRFDEFLIQVKGIDIHGLRAEYTAQYANTKLDEQEVLNDALGQVSLRFDIPKLDILIRSRKREIVLARMITQCLIYQKLSPNTSLKRVGLLTGGYDHSSIINSRKSVSNFYETNKNFKFNIDGLFAHFNLNFEIYKN